MQLTLTEGSSGTLAFAESGTNAPVLTVLRACCAIIIIVTFGGCAIEPVTARLSPAFFKKDKPMRIAVLTFEASTGNNTNQALWSERSIDKSGELLADQFTTELVSMDGMIVVERSRLKVLLAEHQMSESEIVSKGQYAVAGRLLGVDAFILGSVHELVHLQIVLTPIIKVSFSARCVDVAGGEILWSITGARSASLECPGSLIQLL